MKQSNSYKEYMQFKEDYQIAKENIRDELAFSQNPLIRITKDLLDKIPTKSETSSAFEILRRTDPDFDIFQLESEVEYLVKQIMGACFRDDSELISKLSSDTALGMLTSIIKTRKERVIFSK